jgi:hypothetical protein
LAKVLTTDTYLISKLEGKGLNPEGFNIVGQATRYAPPKRLPNALANRGWTGNIIHLICPHVRCFIFYPVNHTSKGKIARLEAID